MNSFFLYHQLCSSLRLVSLLNSTVFKRLVQSAETQLSLQIRKVEETFLIGSCGCDILHDAVEAKRVKTTRRSDIKGRTHE